MRRIKGRYVGVSAAVLGFALAGGGTAIATGALASGDQVIIRAPISPGGAAPRSVAAPAWPTNANGQTYGSLLNSTSSATDPDLAQVIATNGQTGYVYSSQLNPPAPSSPAEALAQQAADTAGEYIPVYAQNGRTVIGQFEVAQAGRAAG